MGNQQEGTFCGYHTISATSCYTARVHYQRRRLASILNSQPSGKPQSPDTWGQKLHV